MNKDKEKSVSRSVAEYREVMQKPVRPRTVTLFLKGDEVLLGLKMRGFGKGNYVGIGGKVEEDKDRTSEGQDFLSIVKSGAQREIQEEIGISVSPTDLQPMGVLNFYFPHIADESWNQAVYVFVARNWQGEPKSMVQDNGEVEIAPEWFKFFEAPLKKMWDDAQYWLPLVLEGKEVNAEFVFDDNLKVIDHVASQQKS